MYWTFGQAESSFYMVVNTALPAVVLFEAPLQTIDKILCKSLDIVEQRVPSINLPPELVIIHCLKTLTFAIPIAKFHQQIDIDVIL